MLINEARLYRNVFSVMLRNDLKRYIDF
ncbi:hypothetical protein [Staphylococcus aureus subsp. aureus MW2]|nr:hypothetical protein S103564_2012 [Staphylococcus aureus subsp. aureus 103564]BAB96479.1 hypothetical protein [Staphylococcus aureus subsp. aureus MW2]CAG44397.1 hypothetical protein SAS2579a [Staphylococcus aureus subsp. aureus MSSA476]